MSILTTCCVLITTKTKIFNYLLACIVSATYGVDSMGINVDIGIGIVPSLLCYT